MVQYQVVSIIPAAGIGQRMNAGVNKIWLTINGQCLLNYVLNTFLAVADIAHILLVVNQAEIGEVESHLRQHYSQAGKISVIAGGQDRQASVLNGLRFYQQWPGWTESKRIVAIHDAARILLTEDILRKAIDDCIKFQAVGVAVPVKDTIKQIDHAGYVINSPDRSSLRAVQTPQVFDFDLIAKAHEQAALLNQRFTDDCAILEFGGFRVKLVEGSYENFKITTPEDLSLAEAIIRRRMGEDRSGI